MHFAFGIREGVLKFRPEFEFTNFNIENMNLKSNGAECSRDGTE
jgi:hypothetical protein